MQKNGIIIIIVSREYKRKVGKWMQVAKELAVNQLNIRQDIQELIAGSKNGEERAFEELLEIFKRMIYKISKMYYFPDGDFDDVTQECMIAFWSAIESYDKKKSGRNIESYLHLCMTRRMITALRKSTNNNATFTNKALEIVYETIYNEAGPSVGEGILYPIYSESPEISYMAAELRKDYIKEIRGMDIKNFEEIAKLRYCGYSYKEISEILQLSSKDIDNILYRGRQNLRKSDLSALN